jgi:hypothetical protein
MPDINIMNRTEGPLENYKYCRRYLDSLILEILILSSDPCLPLFKLMQQEKNLFRIQKALFRIRIQVGRNCPQRRKFFFVEVLCWAKCFSWSLHVLMKI